MMVARCVVAATAAGIVAAGMAYAQVSTGTICIASFVDQSLAEPMLLPRPGPDSEYTFKIDGRSVARIKTGQPAVRADNVPADRPVRVAVILGSTPTETVTLDLRRQRRLCLALAYGYANWRVSDPSLCKC